jgi:hypothetical protein
MTEINLRKWIGGVRMVRLVNKRVKIKIKNKRIKLNGIFKREIFWA